MNKKFEKILDGIYRLCVPFDNIYTSVFLLKSNIGSILLDAATTQSDVNDYIIPALNDIDTVPDYIICSHLHSDHCGGMEYLLEYFSYSSAALISKNKIFNNKTIHLCDGYLLFENYKIISMPGHTNDCLGILDISNRTLLSCDSLQQYGVDKYRTYLENKTAYMDTIEKIRKMDLNTIVFAHNYEPFGYIVNGVSNIEKCLNLCEETTK